MRGCLGSILKGSLLIAVSRSQTLADAVGDFEEFGGFADAEGALSRER
jgi:hypothetical protein